MRDKPDIGAVGCVIPEASNLVEIGSGGYKVVYRATVAGEEQAVKLVRIPTDGDGEIKEENLGRLRREIALLSECESPFLVKLASIEPREVVIGSDLFVVYSEERVPGETIRERMRRKYEPSIGDLAEAGLCLLRATAELAGKGVVHRDIKPDNVMITGVPERPAVLLDLGIAFQTGGTPLTRDSGQLPGTLHYIAPEMLDPKFRQNLDHRADLYTIGLTLYEYASGVNPFRDPNEPGYTTLYRIKTKTPAPLVTHRPDLSIELCRLIDQLLKKLPALRPSSISSLIARMEGLK